MKKCIALILALFMAEMIAQESNQKIFHNMKLVNGDFRIPSETDIIGWSLQYRNYPGTLKIETENDAPVLKITPGLAINAKERAQGVIRTLVDNSTLLKIKNGDRIRISFECKSDKNAKVGVVINHNSANNWIIWQVKCDKNWKKL